MLSRLLVFPVTWLQAGNLSHVSRFFAITALVVLILAASLRADDLEKGLFVEHCIVRLFV